MEEREIEREMSLRVILSWAIMLALLAVGGTVMVTREFHSPEARLQRALEAGSLDAEILAGNLGIESGNSRTLALSRFKVDPHKLGDPGVKGFLSLGDPQREPDEISVATTAEVEHAISAISRESDGIEGLLNVGLWHPELCAPGPCAALGSSYVDERGTRYVPAILYENGVAHLYMTYANPGDGWNASFKFILKPQLTAAN